MPASARLAPENGPAARSPAHPHLRTTRLLRRLLAPENEPTARSPAHPHLRTTRLLRRLLAPENEPTARSPAHPHLRTTRLLRRLLAPENEPTARSPAHPHLRTTRLLRRLLASEQNELELCSPNFGNAGLGGSADPDLVRARLVKEAGAALLDSQLLFCDLIEVASGANEDVVADDRRGGEEIEVQR